MLYRALWRLRFDSRACTVQRLPGRLVTTPQTVQSFKDQPGPAQMGEGVVTPRLTLVTLDCRPFDIVKSVSEVGGGVYSPGVLHLRGHLLAGRTHDDVKRNAILGGCRIDEGWR